MLIVRWLAVWDARDGAKTDLQMFPAAKHVAAPYPVHCRLAVLGEGANRLKPVTLEGAKVNQPVSLCLNEIFPEMNSLCGVSIELLPTRRSLDLTFSRCHLERKNPMLSVRYIPWAQPVLSKPARHNPGVLWEKIERKVFPAVVENGQSYSLLSVNATDSAAAVKIGLSGVGTDSSVEVVESDERGTKHIFSVSGKSCVELPLRHKDARMLISLEEPRNDDVAVYLMGRDSVNGSVRTLSSF
jgi:hypothetical protein